MSTTFKIKNDTFTIRIGYRDSIVILPEKFGIHLSRLFSSEEAASETLSALVLDDERSLKLMYYYVEEQTGSDWDEFLDSVSPKELDEFREAFWTEVENFSGPLKKNLLRQIWTEFKREIKKSSLEKMNTGPLLSDSDQEESK